MLYLTVFVILVLLSYEFDFCKKTRKWKLWYYFILFTLILIAGLRYRLGNDTINYMNWFAKLPTFSNYKINFGDYEIGFVLLSVLVKSIGGGFYLLQIVVAAIFNISFFSFIKRYCKPYFFTCILIYFYMYYFESCFEIMRASIAMGIFLYAIPYIETNKYKKYFLYCFGAFCFHYSAIILFFLPLCKKIKLNKYSLLIIIILLISYLYLNSIFKEFFVLLALNERMASTAEFYTESDTFGAAGGLNIKGYIGQCFIPIIVLLLPLFFYKRWTGNRYKFEYMIVLMSFAQAMIIGIPILYRIAYYFYPLAIVCMAHVLLLATQRMKYVINRYLVIFILIILPYFTFFFFTGYYTKMSGYHRYYMYYPYSSIFNEEECSQRETIYRRL